MRPNIVMIMSDQHTPNVLGCYGNQYVKTPNIDNIAKEGVIFENAYCNNAVCVPSRTSMLTGLHSHKINVWCNADPLLPHLATWPLLLQLAGYETVISGRMHLMWGDRLGGFGRRLFGDENHKIPYIKSDATMVGGFAPQGINTKLGIGENYGPHDREANAHAINYLRKETHKPFALYIGYYQPHPPFVAPKEFFNQYKTLNSDLYVDESIEDIYMPLLKKLQLDREIEPEKLQKAVRAYYGMVSHVDSLVGEIASVLEETGLLDNTVFIYTSDHGEMLGRHRLWHKMNFYENSVRVPLAISFPKRFGRGKRLTENISLLDLFPTFLSLADFSPKIELDGHSLLPLLDGEKNVWNNEIIAESIGVVRGQPGIMLKRGNLKLLLYHKQKPVLFDLEKDPQEHRNVANDKKYSQILYSMNKEATREWNVTSIVDSLDKDLKHIYFHKEVEKLKLKKEI